MAYDCRTGIGANPIVGDCYELGVCNSPMGAHWAHMREVTARVINPSRSSLLSIDGPSKLSANKIPSPIDISPFLASPWVALTSAQTIAGARQRVL